jgi:hypothetical protein
MKSPLMSLISFTLIIIGLVGIYFWLMIGYGVHGSAFRLRWEHLPLALFMGFCFWVPIRNWFNSARSNRS